MTSLFPFVFFNVKTTEFSKGNRIIQIAASYDNLQFDVYITPIRPIHWKATEITGFRLCNGTLYLHNRILRSMPAKYAFKKFMDYLKSINRRVILVAHNCFEFDMPKILKLASELKFLNKFRRIVSGFSDTLLICKYILRNQRQEKRKFTLRALVKDFTSNLVVSNFNDAQHEVEALRIIVFNSELRITPEIIMQYYKNIDTYLREHKNLLINNSESLNYYSNSLPNWVINRMAKAHIDRYLLQNTYLQNGFIGIFNLLAKTYSGRPRVTRKIPIIINVCDTVQDDFLDNFKKL